jgi:hypothetical protein
MDSSMPARECRDGLDGGSVRSLGETKNGRLCTATHWRRHRTGMREDRRVWMLGTVGVACLAVVAAGMVLYATRYGPWAFGDSTGYITTARNLLSGIGLGMVNPSGEFRPLSHFPPLYPLLLGAIGALQIDVIDAARVIDVVLLGLLVATVGWGIGACSGSAALGVLMAGLVLCSPILVGYFCGAVSEPLFIVLTVAFIAFLLAYFRSGRRVHVLLGALAAGLALLTRYVGVAGLATGIVGILLLGRTQRVRRWVDAGAFAVLGGLPTLGWLGYLALQPLPRGPRVWAVDLSDLWQRLGPFRVRLVDAIWSILPTSDLLDVPGYRWRLLALVGLSLLEVGILIQAWRASRGLVEEQRSRAQQAGGLGDAAALSMLYIACYGLVLAGSWLFSLPGPNIGVRIASPILPMLFVATLAPPFLWAGNGVKAGWIRAGVTGAAGLLIMLEAPTTVELVRSLHANGDGYTSRTWRASETIQAVRQLPAGVPIVSNQPDAVLLLTGRPAYEMAEIVQGVPIRPFSAFGDDRQDDAQRAFAEQGAALVLFESVRNQLRWIYHGEGQARLEALTAGLFLHSRAEDGSIYFAQRPTEP